MVVADPAYANEKLLVDYWDRECFSKFVQYDFTDAEWDDFVDFCAFEQIAWAHWFEQWCNSERRAGPMATEPSNWMLRRNIDGEDVAA